MSIYFIHGNPGSGKTAYATYRARKLSKHRKVYTNFHTLGGISEFALWSKMKRASNAVVIIDEPHVWFPCRGWDKTKPEELLRFQQHRKNGLDMILIAQWPEQVDKQIRDLAIEWIEVVRLGPIIWARRYRPHQTSDGVNKNKHYGGHFVWIGWTIKHSYWSSEVIGEPDGRGYEFGSNDDLDETAKVFYLRISIGLTPQDVLIAKKDSRGNPFDEALARRSPEVLVVHEADPRIPRLVANAVHVERCIWDPISGTYAPWTDVEVGGERIERVPVTEGQQISVKLEPYRRDRRPGFFGWLFGWGSR